jgi:hypothetical protein
MFNETTDKLFSQMPSIGGMKEHLDQRTRGDKYISGVSHCIVVNFYISGV